MELWSASPGHHVPSLKLVPAYHICTIYRLVPLCLFLISKTDYTLLVLPYLSDRFPPLVSAPSHFIHFCPISHTCALPLCMPYFSDWFPPAVSSRSPWLIKYPFVCLISKTGSLSLFLPDSLHPLLSALSFRLVPSPFCLPYLPDWFPAILSTPSPRLVPSHCVYPISQTGSVCRCLLHHPYWLFGFMSTPFHVLILSHCICPISQTGSLSLCITYLPHWFPPILFPRLLVSPLSAPFTNLVTSPFFMCSHILGHFLPCRIWLSWCCYVVP